MRLPSKQACEGPLWDFCRQCGLGFTHTKPTWARCGFVRKGPTAVSPLRAPYGFSVASPHLASPHTKPMRARCRSAHMGPTAFSHLVAPYGFSVASPHLACPTESPMRASCRSAHMGPTAFSHLVVPYGFSLGSPHLASPTESGTGHCGFAHAGPTPFPLCSPYGFSVLC